MKFLHSIKKVFGWVDKVRKFSQSLEIFLEHADSCTDDISKIWNVKQTSNTTSVNDIETTFKEVNNEKNNENNSDSILIDNAAIVHHKKVKTDEKITARD